jgi:hypothetical protein
MRKDRFDADVTCFWYGTAGAKFPVIPGIDEDVRTALANLPAASETDFHPD